MKEQIRAFSYGLFAAGIIVIVSFFFLDQPEKNAKEMAVDDIIDKMKDEGYRVISEAEYISLAVNEDDSDDAQDKEQPAKKDRSSDDNDTKEKDTQSTSNNKDQGDDNKKKDDRKKKSKDDDDEKSPKKYTLHIKSGMASSEIGSLLAKNDIIKDSKKFNKFLKDNDYDERVQLGKFKVNSDMNFREIAEKITK